MSNTSQLQEVDELRRQVADLSRELADRERVSRDLNRRLDSQGQDHGKLADALHTIIKETAAATGGDFFRMMVRSLADALNVRYAFVGEWCEDRPDSVRTVAVWSGSAFTEPFDYCLRGTPCANVVERGICLYDSDVQRLFPDDHLLAEMKVESYCGMPLFDHLGKPLGLLVVMDAIPMSDTVFIQDVLSIFAGRAASELERTRVENERAKALALLNNVIETVPDIIFTLSLQGNLVGWNNRMEVVTGFSPEELKDRPALAFVPEAEHDKTAAAIQKAFHEGYAELEGHLLIKTGQQIPYHWTGAVLKDHQGRVTGITGVGRDISERKQAERRLEQAQEILRLTQFSVDQASDGFFWISPDARILHVNEAACRLLEYSREELTSMTVHDIDPNFPPEAWSAHWEELKTKGFMMFESKHWSSSGKVLGTEVAVNYLRYNDKEFNCAIMRDIGERKRVESIERERLAQVIRFKEAQLQLDRLSHENLSQDFQTITRTGAETIGIERVGIWLFNEDHSALVCHDLYRMSLGRHDGGAILESSCYPIYIESLERELPLVVTDALMDPRTREFAMSYLEPLDIVSMMDIAVRRDGRIIGVVCFEQTGTKREWSLEEQAFAVSMADQVALCLAGAARRQAEQALRESEERFSKAFNEAAIGMALVSPDGRWLQVNRALCVMLGYSKDELERMTVQAITYPDDLPANVRFIDGVLRGDLRAFHLETRHLHKQGHVIWVILSVSLMRDAAGTPLHLTLQIQDITERKRVADELRRSHALIRQIIDTDPNFIFAKDREGRFTLVNKAVADIYGTTVADMVGKTDADFNPNHAEVEFFRKKDLEVLETRRELVIPEEVVTDSSGTTHWLQTVKRPVLDEQGSATMVLGVATDITARKQVEEALRLSLERFDLAVEASQDGLWDIQIFADDPFNPRHPIYYSPYMKGIMGVEHGSETDVLGTWVSLVHTEDRDRIFAALTAHLNEREAYDVEYRIVKPNGDIRWIAARGQAQWDATGRPIRMSGSFRDITERKGREEALRDSEERLRLAMEIGRLGAWDWNIAENCATYSSSLSVIFGFSPEMCQVTLEQFMAAVLPDDRERLGKAISLSLETDTEFFEEYRVLRPDGSIRWVSDLGKVYRDESGIPVRMIGIVTDVSERKQAEEALRQREQDLRQALEERERISQDLHDGILQSLYATGLTLESCKPLLAQLRQQDSVERDLIPTFNNVIGQLNHVMKEVRNFIAGLESQVLQGGDFATALQTMAQSMAEANHTACRVTIDKAAAGCLSTEQAFHLLNVTREALSNSLRHGKATQISVSFKRLNNSVQLSIADNGIGFDQAAAHGVGHGLANMAARVRKIRGQLALRTRPRYGTRIVVDLPEEAAHATH